MEENRFTRIQGAYLSDNRIAVLKESNGAEIHVYYLEEFGWCLEARLEKLIPALARRSSLLRIPPERTTALELRSSRLDTVIYSSEGEIIFANDGAAFCITRGGELLLESCTVPFLWHSDRPTITFQYPRPQGLVVGLPGIGGDPNRNGRSYTFSPHSIQEKAWPLLFHPSPSLSSWISVFFDTTEKVTIDLGEENLDSAIIRFRGDNPRFFVGSGATIGEASRKFHSLLPPCSTPPPWQLGYQQIVVEEGGSGANRLKTPSALHTLTLPCDGVHTASLKRELSEELLNGTVPLLQVTKSKITSRKELDESIAHLPDPSDANILVFHKPRRAEWTTLREEIDDLISSSLAGIRHQGPLIPGALGHTTEGLAVRFFQLGAFMPLFLGISGIEQRNKLPNNYRDKSAALIRRAMMLRYSLAREWHSNYERCCREGRPIILPTIEPDGSLVRDQFILFDKFLVAPVIERDQKHRQVYLPAGEWYTFGDPHNPLEGDTWLLLPVDERAIPVFVKAGSIVVRNTPQLTIEDSLLAEEYFEIYRDRYGNALGYWFQDSTPPIHFILSTCNYSNEVMKLQIGQEPVHFNEGRDEL